MVVLISSRRTSMKSLFGMELEWKHSNGSSGFCPFVWLWNLGQYRDANVPAGRFQHEPVMTYWRHMLVSSYYEWEGQALDQPASSVFPSDSVLAQVAWPSALYAGVYTTLPALSLIQQKLDGEHCTDGLADAGGMLWHWQVASLAGD